MTRRAGARCFRDLWGHRSRSFLVIMSIAVGVAALGIIGSVYTIISRDLPAGYNAASPMSARLFTDAFDDDLIRVLSNLSGVGEVEGRRTLTARIKVTPRGRDGEPQWRDIDLFAIPDYEGMQINKIAPEVGRVSARRARNVDRAGCAWRWPTRKSATPSRFGCRTRRSATSRSPGPCTTRRALGRVREPRLRLHRLQDPRMARRPGQLQRTAFHSKARRAGPRACAGRGAGRPLQDREERAHGVLVRGADPRPAPVRAVRDADGVPAHRARASDARVERLPGRQHDFRAACAAGAADRRDEGGRRTGRGRSQACTS